MLTHPTLDQLRALKPDGMADAFRELEQQDAARDLTHAEWLALLPNGSSTKHSSSSSRLADGLPRNAICSLAANAAWAKPGLPAPWLRGPAARGTAPITRACRASSRSWNLRTLTAASTVSSVRSPKSICSFWT